MVLRFLSAVRLCFYGICSIWMLILNEQNQTMGIQIVRIKKGSFFAVGVMMNKLISNWRSFWTLNMAMSTNSLNDVIVECFVLFYVGLIHYFCPFSFAYLPFYLKI